jgi:hypothetical protein
VKNLEKLLEVMVGGKLGEWYKRWECPVPDPTDAKIKDLENVYKIFKSGDSKKRVINLRPEDVNSNLVRAYLLAGNMHPAKLPESKGLFSKNKAHIVLTYEWSLGLSKKKGVLSKLNDEKLRHSLAISWPNMADPEVWIDVFFIDQLSQNVTMNLARAQGFYINFPCHVALASKTLLERGWCLFELCLRHHAGKKTFFVGHLDPKVWQP